MRDGLGRSWYLRVGPDQLRQFDHGFVFVAVLTPNLVDFARARIGSSQNKGCWSFVYGVMVATDSEPAVFDFFHSGTGKTQHDHSPLMTSALRLARGYERLDRTAQVADDFTYGNQIAALTLHGLFSHVSPDSPAAKLTEGVSIDDYSTWRAVRFAERDETG